jgi:hypothetical protein
MKAKVFNDNIFEYKERFKGDQIVIPAKGYIEMQYEEAMEFKSTFSPIVLDADGRPKAEGFKMIRVEPIGDPTKAKSKLDENKCHACGKVLESQAALAAHILEVHPESLSTDSRDEALASLARMKQGKGK